MANNKIIYGIDLGTTNSAIAKFENGTAVIKKNEMQGDITPSCVSVSPKGRIAVGAKAYRQLEKDCIQQFKKSNYQKNTFVEFKRIMGTDETLHSSNLEKTGQEAEFTPEQLSAEVLKTLRSYVLDEDVKEAVITVPALFNNNQKDATKAAAKLAGFDHYELIQEPVAASVAYGLGAKMKNSLWVVFDLGGGTFDAALMKMEDGIMKAVDTEGNNHLGGKDIDQAIVEQLFIPYLEANYEIEECLQNPAFRSLWKFKAEEAKIALSFNDSYDIQTDLGDDYGCDDHGEEFELDISLTEADLEPVEAPIFQKAIDLTQKLLRRNNLSGEDLGALVLVGGPTHSPVLRRMLREQITDKVDTSIDPMTAVACGAALYGSTIDVPSEIVDKRRDRSKVQLEITAKSTSVEEYEFAAVKFLSDMCNGYNEDKVFVEMARTDGAFTTERIPVDKEGDVLELRLKTEATNVFEVRCYDHFGNKLDCEPSQVIIIQGIDGIGDAVLPLHLGIGTIDREGDVVFTPMEGLKKNMPLPGYGKNGSCQLCTDRPIRPGMDADELRFPILQTNEDIDQMKREHKKLKQAYCTHLYDLILTGNDIPALLPKGSEVNFTAHADKSGNLDSFVVDIPYLNFDKDIYAELSRVRAAEADKSFFNAEIKEARGKAKQLGNINLSQELDKAADSFNKADSRDEKDRALDALKEALSKIDTEYSLGDWLRMEKKLRNMFSELEEDNQKYGNDKTTAVIHQLKTDMERIIAAKDMDEADKLWHKLWNMDYKMAEVEYFKAWLSNWQHHFEQRNWTDKTRARNLVDKGMEIVTSGNATTEKLRPIVNAIFDLLPYEQKPQNEGLLRQRSL